MGKTSISFFAMNFILLFLVISFILIVFDLHRFTFVFELMFMLVSIFLFSLAIFIIYHGKKFGWTILGGTLILALVNLLLVVLVTRKFETEHITALVFSFIGILITLLNFRGSGRRTFETQHEAGKIKDYYPFIDKMEPMEEKIEEKNAHIKKAFTPGKYIASKKAHKFHSPKCDWALKISEENQLWFDSREDAVAQGFEADKCAG